jgi:hypothetical protein
MFEKHDISFKNCLDAMVFVCSSMLSARKVLGLTNYPEFYEKIKLIDNFWGNSPDVLKKALETEIANEPTQ